MIKLNTWTNVSVMRTTLNDWNHLNLAYLLAWRGRGFWAVLQPASRGTFRCFGLSWRSGVFICRVKWDICPFDSVFIFQFSKFIPKIVRPRPPETGIHWSHFDEQEPADVSGSFLCCLMELVFHCSVLPSWDTFFQGWGGYMKAAFWIWSLISSSSLKGNVPLRLRFHSRYRKQKQFGFKTGRKRDGGCGGKPGASVNMKSDLT